MANGLKTYVLAVRRGARETAPADWQIQVRKLLGASPGADASPFRIQIEADADKLHRIREEFGEFLRIELLAPRVPKR